MKHSPRATADDPPSGAGQPAAPARPDRLGHYLLRREIGRGFSSVVFEAVDMRRQRVVALKVLTFLQNLSRERREDLRGRFAREARAISALSHPGIVAVYEVGHAEDGRQFIAMEFLPGETLRARLLRERALPAGEAVSVALQVADALQYAHERGIIHRDVKPDNVFLLPDGRVKLMDFGVAHVPSDGTLTQTGTVVGSPAYMSPEQIHGERLDGRSDVFSLGVMLAEMVTGRKPFDAATIPAVMHRILNRPPRMEAVTPRALRRIIEKSLSKNRQGRFQCAAALADALRSQMLRSQNVFPQGRRSPPRAARWGMATLLGLPLLGAVYLSAQAPPHSRPAFLGQPERAAAPAEAGVVRHIPASRRASRTEAPERGLTRPSAALTVRIMEGPPPVPVTGHGTARPVTQAAESVSNRPAAPEAPTAGASPARPSVARTPQLALSGAARPSPARPIGHPLSPAAIKTPVVKIGGFRREQALTPPDTPQGWQSPPADKDWERIDVADAPPGVPASAPRLLRRTAPIYPPAAWAAGKEGTTTLRVTVDEDGSVIEVSVIASAGTPDLDRAAVASARAWEFEPAFRGGRTIRSQVTERVGFAR